MSKKKLCKCHKCKQEIVGDFVQIAQKNRQGNYKYYQNGDIKYEYYHNDCWNQLEFERNGWNNLYEYIRIEFSLQTLPIYLVKLLKDFREFYNYQDMLGALKENVEYLKKIEFRDGMHASNAIMYQIKNNICTYIKQKAKKEMENFEVQDFQFLNIKKASKKEDIENEDYDFLDD